MGRPNIVYIHSHDTGRYIQPYGYAVPTPRLQALAEEGIFFRQAFSAAPTCSASRAALLTGQAPHSAGMLGLAHRGFRLNDPAQHLATTLRAAGYDTYLCGIQHVMPADEALAVGYNALLGTAKEAEQAAARFLDAAPSRPFFLDIGFFETHRARGIWHHHDGTHGDPRYVRPPCPLPDIPEIRQDFADYAAAAETLDAKMSVVLDALPRNGLTEDTLVLYTTDHGPAFPHMKCNLTGHGTGVALILRWPVRLGAGHVIDGLVSHIDTYPTLCELLEIASPPWLQGTSLVPLLDGTAEEVNDGVFSEVTFHAAYEPMRAVRTRRFNYIRRYDPRHSLVLPNCDDSPSKTLLLSAGWSDHPPEEEQLYDLLMDPVEIRSVAREPEYGVARAKMRAHLESWMRETEDPLLQGPVAAPTGALLNDPGGLSPNEPPFRVEEARQNGRNRPAR